MLQQVFCTGCGADGRLPVSLRFDQVFKTCETCRHDSISVISYSFCTVACFLKWAHDLKGLPCGSCRGTGNAFGFAENGPCTPCGGTTLITENKVEYVRGNPANAD